MTGVIRIMMTVNLNDAIGYAYDMTGKIHIMLTVNLNDTIVYTYMIYICCKIVPKTGQILKNMNINFLGNFKDLRYQIFMILNLLFCYLIFCFLSVLILYS